MPGYQVCHLGIQYHLCTVQIEDLRVGGCSVQWWSTGQLKPEVSWVRLLATAGHFTFLYFCLITSKFLHFQHEARFSEHKHLVLVSTWPSPIAGLNTGAPSLCLSFHLVPFPFPFPFPFPARLSSTLVLVHVQHLLPVLHHLCTTHHSLLTYYNNVICSPASLMCVWYMFVWIVIL